MQGHIAPYTDIEFQSEKMLNIHVNQILGSIIKIDIQSGCRAMDSDKTGKEMVLKQYFIIGY